MRREAVPDRNERRAIEQCRPRLCDAQQQIAVAERLRLFDRHPAQPQIAHRNRLGQRLNVVAFQMRADYDELHLICFGCDVRMIASTFASTMLRPRQRRSTSPIETTASPAMTTPRSSR